MWRPIGDVGDCPCGGRIVTYIHHEFGSTDTRCVDCKGWTRADIALSSRPDAGPTPTTAPRYVSPDMHITPLPRKKRKPGPTKVRPDRLCPRGDRCLGNGLMPKRRGKPSRYGCDPCRAGRHADRVAANGPTRDAYEATLTFKSWQVLP